MSAGRCYAGAVIRRTLGASFVVTVASCGSEGPREFPPNPPPPQPPPRLEARVREVPGPHAPGVQRREHVEAATQSDDTLSERPDGCLLFPFDTSSARGFGNPPAPIDVACAPSLPRPPGKEGWYQRRATFWSSQGTCTFQGDAYCPPPSAGGGYCTPAERLTLACPAGDGPPGRRQISVPAFTYQDGLGQCRAVPASSCAEQSCTLAALPAPAPCPAR